MHDSYEPINRDESLNDRGYAEKATWRARNFTGQRSSSQGGYVRSADVSGVEIDDDYDDAYDEESSARANVPAYGGDERKILLRAINEILNTEYPLKALFSDGEGGEPSEFDQFRVKVQEYVFGDLSEEDLTEQLRDFSRAVWDDLHVNDDVAVRELGLKSRDELDEDRRFDFVLKMLFFYAGGSLIGSLSEPKLRRRRQEDPDFEDDSSTRSERANSAPYPSIARKSADADFAFRFSPPSDFSQNFASRVFDSVASSFPRVVAHSSLAAYQNRRSESSAPQVSLSPSNAACGKVVALLDDFFKTGYASRAELSRLLRFASIRFFPKEQGNGEDNDEAIAAYLLDDETSDSLDSSRAVLKELIDRLVKIQYRRNLEGVGKTDVEELFRHFDALGASRAANENDSNWLAMTTVKAFARALGGDAIFRSAAKPDFSAEYLEAARIVLNSFVGRVFNPDFSDFGDFRTAFEKTAGEGAKLGEERLREIFKEAGGRFNAPRATQSEKPVEPWTQSRSELIKKIVSEEFSNGLSIDSSEDLERFREIGRRYSTPYFEEPDDKLAPILARCCAMSRRKLYSLSDKHKKQLKDLVESFFRIGAQIIFFDAFFEKNSSFITTARIPNVEALRALLALCFPKYIFYEDFMEQTLDDSSECEKVRNEILRVWSARKPFSAEDVADRLYVGVNRVEAAMTCDVNHFERRAPNLFDVIEGGKDVLSNEQISSAYNARLNLSAEKAVALSGKSFLAALNGEPTSSESPAEETKSATTKSEDRSTLEERSAVEKRRDEWAQKAASLFDMSETQEFAPADALTTREPSVTTSSADAPKPRAATRSKSAKERGEPDRNELAQKQIVRKILSHYKSGFNVDDPSELARFVAAARESGLEVSDDEDALAMIRRAGIVCGSRVYLISKKAGEELRQTIERAFNSGARMIYYSELFERNREWLVEGGIPNPEPMINRLRKYFPTCVFYDEYFEPTLDERDESEKLKDEILRLWIGDSSKRIADVSAMVCAPRDKIVVVLENNSDEFSVHSNGYWSRVQKKSTNGRKRSVAVKRKTSKKK